jgi:hypothetical protein
MIIQFNYSVAGKGKMMKRRVGRGESWRTDVDVFVAESSEPGRHERVS